MGLTNRLRTCIDYGIHPTGRRPKRSNHPLHLPHRCPSCLCPAGLHPHSQTQWLPPQWAGSGWFHTSCCLRSNPGPLAIGSPCRFSKEWRDTVIREISFPWRGGKGWKQVWGWEHGPSAKCHSLRLVRWKAIMFRFPWHWKLRFVDWQKMRNCDRINCIRWDKAKKISLYLFSSIKGNVP